MTTMRKIQLRTGKAGQRGFNLIEAAIVLGIVGLVVGGIWVAASSVYENQRMSRMTQMLLGLANNLRTTLSNQNITAANQITEESVGYVPTDMRGAGANVARINHPWSQAVNAGTGDVWVGTIANTVANFQPRGGFVITVTRLPITACFDLVTKNTGQARDLGLVMVAVAGTARAQNNADTSGAGTPLIVPATGAPANMIAVADNCAPGNANTVSFKFNLAR